GLCGASQTRLDRCNPYAASRTAHVHVLGLHAEPLAARRRTASRPSAAQPVTRAAVGECRGGSSRPRQAQCERPRTGLGDTKGGQAPRRHQSGTRNSKEKNRGATHEESTCCSPTAVGG